MKFEFRSWLTGRVIHTQDIPDDTAESVRCRIALELSVSAGVLLSYARLDRARLDGARLFGARLFGASLVSASLVGTSLVSASLVGTSLDGASLDGARLDRASLVGASLDGARLVGASLVGTRLDRASLVGASLDGANLDRATLDGARLDRATLDGAHLDGAKLRDFTLTKYSRVIQIGPIGSRETALTAVIGGHEPYVVTGCFSGSLTAFRAAVTTTHGGSIHGREYRALIAFVEAVDRERAAERQTDKAAGGVR